VGSQIAILGVVAILCALVLGRRLRAPVLGGAAVLLAFGAGIALPPMAIDAYPVTYLRPPVAYQATSIASGAALYARHCASCHGPEGAGDGPAGRRLPRPPADLRASHTAHHTAGDLFWWISRGIPGAGMPGFGGALTEEERWDLVNLVRALAAGAEARLLGPVVEPERPRIVAPDASFAVGPTAPHTLRDFRSRRLVLLVLYTLPASRARLAALAETYDTLRMLGVEIVAVPRDAAPDAIGRLGAAPPVFFPVATEGAADIVTTYSAFASSPHAEFLIDRQGYLRAVATPERPWTDLNALIAEVQQLNEEKAVAPAPSEHVH
jgi:putative copper resistance protein D